MTLQGLLLAAGAGSRMGTPKALLVGQDGAPWLAHGVASLLGGGCDGVTVVLGARAEDAAALVPSGPVTTVVAADWAEGMSASLRAGLAALAATDAEAAVVTLVDLPDVGAEVIGRVIHRVVARGTGPGVLARATYDGRPGHPVLLGRDHWAGVAETVGGDAGARDYLGSHPVVEVECGDLATGEDVDRPTGDQRPPT
ncbi:MAG: nucleotidyltransferase family protein [Nocardioides sp.]